MIGIVLGITVPLLLIHKSQKTRQKDLRKGLFFMLASVLISALGAIFAKTAADTQANIFLYVVITSTISSVLGGIRRMWVLRKHSEQEPLMHVQKNLGVKKLAIGLGLMNSLAVFFILKSYEGSLAISCTINSFYILIPIILSIIIYKEHMNLRKAVAIV